jgi:hypothetical protein
MKMCSYKLLVFFLSPPVFAGVIGEWDTLKNGSPADSSELRIDNQRCTHEAAIKYPFTNTLDDQAQSGAQSHQNATRKFAHAVGTDISTGNELLSTLGQQLGEQIQIRMAARKRIQEKGNADLIGNPLGWLHGQLTIDEDQRIYDQAGKEADRITESIFQLTQATQAVSETYATLAQTNAYSPKGNARGRGYEASSEVPRDDISDRRSQYHYRCMATLGYERVRVQGTGTDGMSKASKGWNSPANLGCQISTDCERGKSCRSRAGGGSECR